jgi:hypothetical protein
LHSTKESNDDIVEFFKDKDLAYCAYEEELLYEYDPNTKTCKLIGAGGFFLGEEAITSGEATEIPEPTYED